MIPGMRGMDSRRLNAMMKRLGLKVEEIPDVVEVVIVTKSNKIVFREPEVTAMNMQGQKVYQISGEEEILPLDAETATEEASSKFSMEDIKLVAERAGVSEAAARKALEATDGDIAEAIIYLMEHPDG